MHLVSFVLPAYKAKFLSQAIDSILNQSYANFELIIVDDASPENLEKIVDSYQDARIKYYRNEQNIGGVSLVKQWNFSIQYAKGEYVILAADDDIYHTHFLERCLALADKYPDIELIRSGVEQIDEQNRLIGIDGVLPEHCSKYQFLYYWVKGTAFTCIGNYMFKTSALLQKKFIDFPFAFCSDVASTIMMAEKGVANTAEMLFQFRISSIHLSSNKNHLKSKLEATTMFYNWLMNLGYEVPDDKLDEFCYKHTQRNLLYIKCRYDYYNQVIKHLPFSDFYYIRKCTLLSFRDKIVMFLRFSAEKIIK